MSQVKVDKINSKYYYKKARDNVAIAEMAREKGFYQQAFSEAIRAFIAYIDALNIADLGVRSSSENNTETIDVFKRVQITDPERAKTKERIKSEYLRFIKYKSSADYDIDEFTSKDVEKILKVLQDVDFFVKRELEERGHYT